MDYHLDIEKLFKGLAPIGSPAGMEDSVVAEVRLRVIKSARRQLVFFGLCTVGALISLFPALNLAAKGFNGSGFYQYASLMFTDGEMLVGAWREYFLSLAESFPFMGTVAVLGSLFLIISSIKLIFSTIKTAGLVVKPS